MELILKIDFTKIITDIRAVGKRARKQLSEYMVTGMITLLNNKKNSIKNLTYITSEHMVF